MRGGGDPFQDFDRMANNMMKGFDMPCKYLLCIYKVDLTKDSYI